MKKFLVCALFFPAIISLYGAAAEREEWNVARVGRYNPDNLERQVLECSLKLLE